jgi:hypothetical protein
LASGSYWESHPHHQDVINHLSERICFDLQGSEEKLVLESVNKKQRNEHSAEINTQTSELHASQEITRDALSEVLSNQARMESVLLSMSQMLSTIIQHQAATEKNKESVQGELNTLKRRK